MNLNYCFFDCVVISDLYFFQEAVLSNACFLISKDLSDIIDINRQSDNGNVKFNIILFKMMHHLLMLYLLDWLHPLQMFLIFQILHNILTLSSEALFHSKSKAKQGFSKNYLNTLM